MIFQKAIDLSIRVFLCILPLFLFKDYIPSYIQGMFFLMGVFFLYGLTLGTQPVRRFKDTWLKFIYLWLLVCVFFKVSVTPSGEWFNFWTSSAGFLYVLAGITLFIITYSYVCEIEKFFYPIIVVCIINAIFVLFQLTGHDLLWTHAPNISGFFSSENQLSQYSVIAFPLCYFINPYLSIIPLFNLISSGSLSGYLALSIGLGFLIITKQIRKFIGIGIIIMLIVAFAATHPSAKISSWLLGSRFPAWENSINLILKKPYLGYGYQSYNEIAGGNEAGIGHYSEKANPASDWLHNGLEFGMPFLIVVGLFLYNLFKKFKGKKKERITYFLASSVIIGLSLMNWQNMIRFAAVGGMFIVILALLTRSLDEVI